MLPENTQTKDNEIKTEDLTIHKRGPVEETDKKNQIDENTKPSKCKIIVPIVIGSVLVIATIILLVIVLRKKNKEKDKDNSIKKDSYITTKAYENFIIPADGKIKVVGEDFNYKNSIFIVDKNKKVYTINDNGEIKGVTKNDFPLHYYFNETITNGSYLFKDVECFREVDLSKMDSSKMTDVSNMFENSKFEEIYFGTENESSNSENRRYLEENSTEEILEEEKRKEYFDTSKIKKSNGIFMNCNNLKKIQLSPSFNVGKNANRMFKGCNKLENVNTSLISSTEIEEMDSMFEDCKSLKEISFSNDFLTGEVKTLTKVFKNTNLISLDISYLRLYSLENSSNIFDGATIKGTLKIGKYYSNDETRDNLFKEISKVTDSTTNVFTPSGTTINQIFHDIYYTERSQSISVSVIDIDYNIHYKEDENYKIYSYNLHIGLGWDYDENDVYDLDSSILALNANLDYLNRVNFQQKTAYNGIINLNGDDLTGEGEGDDEEIRISLDSLPSEVKILTVQLNSFNGNVLSNVKSAYIRLSADSDIIGTYSINQAGNNIGLLIGCFFKSSSNSWYFKPLNKVIPGNVVTESVSSIQEYLRGYFQIIDEDVYCQHSRKIGDHLHWCGDPKEPPREGWACPQTTSDTNKCWFCKYGCAVSSYLHLIGEYPNEENIKNCVNNNADMDWQKFGYKYGDTPHDNCFGKIVKADGGTHFVHIMKINDDGTCDIFDPNGGRRQGNLNEFESFIIKDS